MALAGPLRQYQSGRRFDGILLLALVVSITMHAGTLYATHRWGDCICHIGKVVCPKEGRDCAPRVNLKLTDAKIPPPPPPPPPPKPKPKPAVVVEKPKPDEPPPAPKAGKVVLPDEAFEPAPPPQSEITVDRPSLSDEVVVRESDVDAPVIATGDIFGHADQLTPGEPGVFGLGGTGAATGAGPFGTGEGGGEANSGESVAPLAPEPGPPPAPAKPKGPSRPPTVLNWSEPPYPATARQQGIEGTVVLRVTVDARGRLGSASVAKSSGHSALDDTAATHVRSLRFSPALKDGEPITMTIRFTVKFRLVNT